MIKPPQFWSEPPSFLAKLLWALSVLYQGIHRFRWMLTTPIKSTVPIICIGNTGMGGAGKTPAALAIGKILGQLSIRCKYLTRGYGGIESGPIVVNPSSHTAEQVGDEPLLLAKVHPTIMSKNRAQGLALIKSKNTDAILMDDGYQNPTLEKALHILVIDGQRGFGNGYVFPAGPLREPLSMSLLRASAIIIIGDPSKQVTEALSALSCPIFKATLSIKPPKDLEKNLSAFAGIAFPEKFFNSLTEEGFTLLSTTPFCDHHLYEDLEIQALRRNSRHLDTSLVTTEKDYVRLNSAQKKFVIPIPVTLEWEDEKSIESFLRAHLVP